MALSDNPSDIAQEWLSSFASGLTSHDAEAVAAVFLPHGWLRDIMTFTWDRRSLEGPQKIKTYLASHLPAISVTNVKLNDNVYFRPASFAAGPMKGVEFGYTFETAIAYGKGYARLLQDGDSEWKALTASTIIVDLKGYEERPGRETIEDVISDASCWGDHEVARKAKIESNPHVLIIGGAQTGLQVAARLKQMDIPALVLERHPRIGDGWRKRYRSLALHTPREHYSLLYQENPSNWPLYAPRDKIATMLETYAATQDLVVWTNSHTVDKPVYDDEKKQWTVTVDHDGKTVELHPAHIVLATGTLGEPFMPSLPGKDTFSGIAIHSTQYDDPKEFTGKDVLVIGAGNTAIDICQDLVKANARTVTMVQRSSTCVVSRSNTRDLISRIWPPGVPVEVSDLKAASSPLGFTKKNAISRQAEAWAAEAALHAKLRKGGVALNMGPEGEGMFLLVYERGGGYWLDKGGADLIASGAIIVKQGIEPTAFTVNGLRFSDGTELSADVVIFATGYYNIRDGNREAFGAEIIDKTGPVWGLNSEGEIRGTYKPSGHPGFWYACGGPFNSRFESKHLAMHIKAADLGLVNT